MVFAISTELGGLLTVLSAVIVIAGALGIAWPILRSKTVTTTNELLQSALDITRRELAEAEKRHAIELAKVKAECAAETSALRGQVEVLTKDLATNIAKAIVDELAKVGIVNDRRTP